jgi:hypothetical protein
MKTPPKSIRLSITVTPEVHAAFKQLSAASGISMGKAMGEWLGDTLDAVKFTAQKVEEARAAPKLVMRGMHAYALGLADETCAVMESLRGGGTRAPSEAKAAGARVLPPSSLTGGKSPGKTRGASK